MLALNIEDKINNKHVNIQCPKTDIKELPVVILHTYNEEEGRGVFEKCEKLHCPNFILVSISNLDWNNEMTPWFAPKLNQHDEDCLGTADEYIEEIIRLSSADEFVNSLPNGLDEMASERGNSYSAGEKQLLAFARIFAHNPSIFILDEATANIDTKTEALIQKSVDKLSKEKTSIFIAHRLSTIVNVDKIIVLNNGEIIEQGSHHELLQIPDGYYNKLYNAYYEQLAIT